MHAPTAYFLISLGREGHCGALLMDLFLCLFRGYMPSCGCACVYSYTHAHAYACTHVETMFGMCNGSLL
jgi:hypothetical protein